MTSDFPVDRVIVSSNEHWLYLDLWPLAAYAYRTLWPEVAVTLVFVSERSDDDPFVEQLRQHGEVVLVRPVADIPQAAQCKLARFFYAAQRGEEVCYIDDVDWIPIDPEWYASRVRQRRPETMLMVGAEVYSGQESGQVPASMMTAEGRVFRDLFNPDGLPFDAFLRSLGGRTERHCDIYSRVNHEGMESTTDFERLPGQQLFSDEALIMHLRRERPIPTTHVMRGYEVGKDTIDRSYWESLDYEKLDRGGYLGAHTGRPYLDHKQGNDAIIDFIRMCYRGKSPLPGIIRDPQIDADMVFGDRGMTREAFAWICEHVPQAASVLEFGSGHVSTNYLTRYYWLVSVENDINLVNIYPSHYIYSTIDPKTGWYDVERVRFGMDHRRLVPRVGPPRQFDLVIVNAPSTRRDGITENMNLIDRHTINSRFMIMDSSDSDSDTLARKLVEKTGRLPQSFNSFKVV